MIYLQLYLVIGITYTIFNFNSYFNYIRREIAKNNYVLYSENRKGVDNLIRVFCLLLIVLWPLKVFIVLKKKIFR